MATISITNLTYAHDGGPTIFDNVSLHLDTGWRLGLIGRNGRGKTTLMKLLLGEYPSGGSIHAPVPMRYFPFAVPKPEASGLDALRAALPGVEEWRLEREASLLDLTPDALLRPYNTLSGGEATRLQLAALFLREDGFALIDEPTNHLDMRARRIVGRYLRGKAGFILVSHDRDLLDGCVERVLSINRDGVELRRGNFSSWESERARRDRRELADNARLQKDITRLEASARRGAAWSKTAEKGKYGAGPVDRGFIGHKAAKMMRRAKSVEARREKAVEEKSRLLRNLENEAPLSMRPLAFHSPRLLELEDVSAGRDGRPAVSGISLAVMRGECLALHGGNGSGKSTLLRLLAGPAGPLQGSLRRPPGLRVSYVPQDASFLRGSLKAFARERAIDESLYRAVLHRFGFERGQFDTDMADFSAGQKKKALLAASLCEEAHLYVWDEPLNYIDVISRMQIEALILACRPSMVLVEHDRRFLERVATRAVQMVPGLCCRSQ